MKAVSPDVPKTLGFDSTRNSIDAAPFPIGEGLLRISNRYELQDRIAEGGIGAIYRAWDRILDRIVAVKIMLADNPTMEEIRRFADEAHTLAQLSHPNIPPIYDHGILVTSKEVGRVVTPYDPTVNCKSVRISNSSALASEQKRHFIALKLIHGDTLANLLKSQGHGSHRWLAVFESLCHAVGYAHEAGYVHRDLKPANIMVGTFGEVQVMDWGLAKKLTNEFLSGLEPTRMLTETEMALGPASETCVGTVMGTPHYMAPEQARGDIFNIDRRTDVFALGAILFELLTGRTPLTGTSTQIIKQCVAGDFESRDQELLNCGEDPQLITLAKRCLAYHPDDRPRDGRDVAHIVSAIRLESDKRAREIEILLAGAELNLLEQRKRRKLWMLSAAVIFVTLTAGIVSSSILTSRAQKSERLANELATKESQLNERLRTSLQDSEASHDLLLKVFRDLDVRNSRADSEPLEKRIISRLVEAGQQLSNATNSDPVWLARQQSHLGETIMHLGDHNAATQLLEKASEIQAKNLGPDHRETLTTLNLLVESKLIATKSGDALPMLEGILEKARGQFGEDDPLTLSMKNNRSTTLVYAGRAKEAVPFVEATLAEVIKKFGPDHEETITARNNLSNVFFNIGEKDRAIQIQQEILPLLEKKYGPDHPFAIVSMYNLSNAYIDLKQVDKGLPLLQETVRRAHAKLSPSDPNRMMIVERMAWVYREASRWSEAAELFREMDQSQSIVFGAEHTRTCHNRALAADSLRRANRIAEAIDLYDGLHGFWARTADKKEDPVPFDLSSYTECLVTVGRHADAADFAEEIYRRRVKSVGPVHQLTINALYRLASYRQNAAQFQQAAIAYEQLIKIQQTQNGPTHADTISNRNALGSVYNQIGRYDDSIQYLRETLELMKNFQPEDQLKLVCENNLAAAFISAGKFKESLALFRRLRTVYIKKYGPGDVNTYGITLNLITCLIAEGHTEESQKMCDTLMEEYLSKQQPMNDRYGFLLTATAYYLLENKWYDRAEKFSREALNVREVVQPDSWGTYNTRAILGRALAGQGKFAEAEPYLSVGYQGMVQRIKNIPPLGMHYLHGTANDLVAIYKKTGRQKLVDPILNKLPHEQAPFPKPVASVSKPTGAVASK